MSLVKKSNFLTVIFATFRVTINGQTCKIFKSIINDINPLSAISSIICSRWQLQILPLYSKITKKEWYLMRNVWGVVTVQCWYCHKLSDVITVQYFKWRFAEEASCTPGNNCLDQILIRDWRRLSPLGSLLQNATCSMHIPLWKTIRNHVHVNHGYDHILRYYMVYLIAKNISLMYNTPMVWLKYLSHRNQRGRRLQFGLRYQIKYLTKGVYLYTICYINVKYAGAQRTIKGKLLPEGVRQGPILSPSFFTCIYKKLTSQFIFS